MKIVKEPIIVYSKESMPSKINKSIFLAGPTVRDKENNSHLEWREEAIEILKGLGYDGIIYSPVDREGEFDITRLYEQIDWERECCKASDVIVFWIPRLNRSDNEMIGLTTNIEFGLYYDSNKLFIGAPEDAYHIDYIKYLSEQKDYKWHTDLKSLLSDVVDYLDKDIPRVGAECKVPKFIFESKQFQNWYKSQKYSGNSLVDYEHLYHFIMPKAKQLFMTIDRPSVYIKEEDRIKDIEFVVSRTDMSYVCAYYKPSEDIYDTEIVLVKEFRTPVRNLDSFVYELPGGSSLDETEKGYEVASNEFKEEVGLEIPSHRFKYIANKQSSATLCSHKIELYSVELMKEEMKKIKKMAENDITHGNQRDTEITHIKVVTIWDLLKKNDVCVDFTNMGMIFKALTEKQSEELRFIS